MQLNPLARASINFDDSLNLVLLVLSISLTPYMLIISSLVGSYN